MADRHNLRSISGRKFLLPVAVLGLVVMGEPLRAEENNSAGDHAAEFRVCADPNNLPFSNRQGEGFENKIAEMFAHALGKRVTYTWWAQRRGFIRSTLKQKSCDVVMGVPAGYELVETTRPYYRSTYVFVSRADEKLHLTSLKDERLRSLKVGVHLIGDDGSNTPPADALGERGIVDNVVGYMIYGNYNEANPPARLIDAVENKNIDIAAAWGPLAGYAAKTSRVPLEIDAITDAGDFAPLRFQFSISMGVRKGDHALKSELDRLIDEKRTDIAALLHQYGVPLVEESRQDLGK